MLETGYTFGTDFFVDLSPRREFTSVDDIILWEERAFRDSWFH